MTSYFAGEIVEVLRADDLMVDAVLLEQPHHPAARHVVGAAIQADARARLQPEAVDGGRAFRGVHRDAQLTRRRSRRSSAPPATGGITNVPGAKV